MPRLSSLAALPGLLARFPWPRLSAGSALPALATLALSGFPALAIVARAPLRFALLAGLAGISGIAHKVDLTLPLASVGGAVRTSLAVLTRPAPAARSGLPRLARVAALAGSAWIGRT